jgi:putative acetyltransferase
MSQIRIVAFRDDHAEAWQRLNEAWLAEGGFAIEAKDRPVLDEPRRMILDQGGAIFIAEQVDAEGGSEVIGCCALIPMADGGMEVAKMTVSPKARGARLGYRLLEACEARAREMGAHRLYLETSSTLAPALALYRRFGFLDLPPQPSPYVRADVWMERRF